MLHKFKFFLVTVLALCLFTPLCAAGLTTYDIYGKPFYLSQTEGKWIIINYWASWCGACISEIPDLNRFAELSKNSHAIFFAVNYDQLPDSEQQDFARHYGVNYTLLHNNPLRNLIPEDAITTLPMTYIISPSGETQQLYGTQSAENLLRIIS